MQFLQEICKIKYSSFSESESFNASQCYNGEDFKSNTLSEHFQE